MNVPLNDHFWRCPLVQCNLIKSQHFDRHLRLLRVTFSFFQFKARLLLIPETDLSFAKQNNKHGQCDSYPGQTHVCSTRRQFLWLSSVSMRHLLWSSTDYHILLHLFVELLDPRPRAYLRGSLWGTERKGKQGIHWVALLLLLVVHLSSWRVYKTPVMVALFLYPLDMGILTNRVLWHTSL